MFKLNDRGGCFTGTIEEFIAQAENKLRYVAAATALIEVLKCK